MVTSAKIAAEVTAATIWLRVREEQNSPTAMNRARPEPRQVAAEDRTDVRWPYNINMPTYTSVGTSRMTAIPVNREISRPHIGFADRAS